MNKQNQLTRTSPPLLIASAFVLSYLMLSPAVQAAPNSNTSYGRGALPGNTMGDFNSAFGVNALGMNSTGSFNTAVGKRSARKQHERRKQHGHRSTCAFKQHWFRQHGLRPGSRGLG